MKTEIKKLMSSLLTIMMVLGLFTWLPQAVYAAETDPTIRVSSTTGKAGDEITVIVSLENNPGISYFRLTMIYPDEKLTVLSDPVLGDIITMLPQFIPSEGQFAFGAFAFGGDAKTGSVLFKVTFKILEGVKDDIDLTLGYFDMSDGFVSGGKDTKIENIIQGKITVEKSACSHDWSYVYTFPPSCEDSGFDLYRCSLCGEEEERNIAALGHDFTVEVNRKEASCEDGYIIYQCSRCEKTETTIILATGEHNWDGGVITAPTCTEYGFTTYACTVCGETEVRDDTDALGHDWGAWGETIAANCEEEGLETRICGNDASHTETRNIAALGHDFTVEVNRKEASCEDGYIIYQCSRCEKTETTIIPATGEHNWDGGVITAPTCTEYGYTTYACIVCGETEVREDTDALGHDWGIWSETTAATCEEEGLETRICGNDASHTETKTIAALGHNFSVEINRKEASCEDGYIIYQCSRCDETETTIIPATGEHNWDDGVITAPTCTEYGFTTYTCMVCGETEVREDTDALGHDWGIWSETIAATCEEEGLETRICGNDASHTETRAITALGHDWGPWEVAVAATCELDGLERRVCGNDANHTQSMVIPPIGHDWDNGVITTPPTEDSEGILTFTCKNCGETYSETIPASDHIPGEGIETPATCEEKGFWSYYCVVCGKLVFTIEIPALGHDWDDGVVTVLPTEETNGVRLFTCRNCGKTYTEIIPAIARTTPVGAPVVGGIIGYGLFLSDISISVTMMADGVEVPGSIAWDDPTEQPPAGTMPQNWTFTPDDTERYTIVKGSTEVTVSKSTPSGTPSMTPIAQAGRTLADANLVYPAGGFLNLNNDAMIVDGALAWDLGDSMMVTANTYYQWTFKPEDSANYNNVTGSFRPYVYYYETNYDDEPYYSSATTGNDSNTGNIGAGTSGVQMITDQEAPLGAFADVAADAWYFSAVLHVFSEGLMVGTTDTSFAPDNPLTRGMVATILHRLAGSPVVGVHGKAFDDVAEDAWYAETVNWAASQGLVVGFGNGLFKPEDAVTVEQFTAFLYRTQQFTGKVPPVMTTHKQFSDIEEANDWALAVVKALLAQGMFDSLPGDRLNSKAVATRAQIASILSRYLTTRESLGR